MPIPGSGEFCPCGIEGRVSERETYSGHGLNAIDAKGRVAIPSGLRATIEANGNARTLVIAKHPSDPCLIGYDRGWLKQLDQRLDREEQQERAAGRPFDYYDVNRSAYGVVEEIPYDASGRFILPPLFRNRAQMTDLAYFFGARHYFEIWNPTVLLETPESNADARWAAAYLLAERAKV